MCALRLPSWLPLAGVLIPAGVAVAGLLLFSAGGRPGMTVLPDSALGFLPERESRLEGERVRELPDDAWQRASTPRSYWRTEYGGIWARVTLRNSSAQPQRGVLAVPYFFWDRVDAWVPDGEGWIHFRSGEARRDRDDMADGREDAFPVFVPAGAERTVYLRAADRFGGAVQPRWWPKEPDYHRARRHELLADSLFVGGLLALLGYNLLLWLRLRSSDIGFYVLYLGTNVVFILLARGFGRVVGGTLTSPMLETVLGVTVALGMFFLIQFARVFLEFPARCPRCDRVARGAGLVALALAAGALSMGWTGYDTWMTAITLMLVVTHLGLLALGLWSWRSGLRQARFFVVSFGCLFAGSIMVAVVWLTPLEDQGLAMSALMIGSGLEMLLLALAMADRFAQAQRRLVEETEQRRMMEETYAEELEIEVRERTRELAEANADKDRMLTIIGHDLRGPLTGLMRQADRAEGEFARDVAQTGRVLLLLIEDLVLWARLRAGTRVLGTHRAGALVAPAAALHRTLAEHGGIALVLAVPEEIEVATDLVLAQTLVRNLLANALKFAETRVTLRAEGSEAGRVRFTVGNDGPPLPPEVAARFAAGLDEPITATGGLGLRLCREICRALGTRLEAARGANGGTEFSFVLEAAVAAETNQR